MRADFTAEGDTLVVTGGASGIGAALARAFAGAGGTSIVLDIAPAPELHGLERVEQHEVDVSDRAAVLRAVSAVEARHGRIDGLVAGAAIQPRGNVLTMEPSMWRRVLDVNLDGVVWSCQAVLGGMVARRRGAIVVLGSGLGRVGHPQAAAYAASKAALEAFARSLAAEVADDSVRVNVLFPGVVDTPQFAQANPEGPERDRWASTVGIGQPLDVVGPLLFLLSDAATMTGSVLTRDRAFPA